MENNVTIKKEGGLPSTALYEGDAHAGFENVKTTSLALPILKLLQNGSGEAQKRNQNYVEGAEPGMFLNTVTKKTYEGATGIEVIPCHYKTFPLLEQNAETLVKELGSDVVIEPQVMKAIEL